MHVAMHISLAVARSSESISTNHTCIPLPAHVIAVDRPIPEEAPVMTATFPSTKTWAAVIICESRDVIWHWYAECESLSTQWNANSETKKVEHMFLITTARDFVVVHVTAGDGVFLK